MAEDHLVQLHVSPRPPTLGVHLYRRLGGDEQGLCRNHGRGHQAQGEAGVEERVAKLEGSKTSLLDFDGTDGKITLGSLGGGMLLTGTLALAGWSRRKKNRR